MSVRLPLSALDPRALLRPRRRGLASVNAEIRDGIVPAGNALAQTQDHAGGEPVSRNFRFTALIIASAMFMEALDATVLSTALPTMARDFGVRAPEMSIALTAYLVALAIFIPASGYMADRFGSRTVLRVAIGIFLAGSIGCGVSPNLGTMTAARFFQGAGGAMMVPVGRLVLLRSVAKRDMVSAMSWLIMPALLGPILGPPLGGFIVTFLDWRWIFWINVPMGIAGIVLVGLYIPQIREVPDYRFDTRGFVVSGIALGCLLGGFELAARPGDAGLALPVLAIGLLAAILYILHARRIAHPILDLSLMRVPSFRLSVFAGSLTRVTQGAQPFLLPLMMQLGFGMSAAASGTITVGTTLGSFLMKPVAPRILRRFGFRTSLILMGLLGTGTYALCALFRPGWPTGAIFAVLVAAGFLMSFQFTAYNTIAYDEVGKDRMSQATSFYATFQQLTLSLGICTAASALHLSMLAHHRTALGFVDFSTAFAAVTAISLCATLFNARFARDAGAELTGRSRG